MLYNAISTGGRDLELTDPNGNFIASIIYPNWYSRKAEITLANGTVLHVAAKGFWQMDVEAKTGEEVRCEIKTGMLGKVTIDYNGSTYRVRRTNIWRNEYMLVTPDEQQMAVVRPIFSIKGFKYRYEIGTVDHDKTANEPLLVTMLVYCVYMLRMRAASAAV